VRQERARWEARLRREGLTVEKGTEPYWYRVPMRVARSLLGGRGFNRRDGQYHTSVKLPSDFSLDAQQCSAERAITTRLNALMAVRMNDLMSDWVWRDCPWVQYPVEHRKILEMFVIDGASDYEIAEAIGCSYSSVRRALTTHRKAAGLG
jgi:hypothetical protein